MKKLFLVIVIIIFLCILSVLIATTGAKADTINVSDSYVPNFFHAQLNANGTPIRYGQMQIWNTNTNQVSYCIAPSETFRNGTFTLYDKNTTNILELINNTQEKDMNKLTQEQLDEIELIQYYGYGYTNHSTIKYRVATQMLIWRVMDPTRTFTDKNCLSKDCKKISDSQAGVLNEMEEIRNLVSAHNVRPSFNGDSIDLTIGKTKTITDTKGVLSKYKVSKCTNCIANIDGNNLNITGTGAGNFSIRLETNTNNYSNPLLFGLSEDNQNQLIVGNIDPVYSSLGGVVTGGNVSIVKSDKDTDVKLSNVKFEVYNSNNVKVCDIITDSSGKGSCSNLSYGNYILKEIEAKEGYELLKDTIAFTIDENNTNLSLNVENEIIKTSIEIFKEDSEFEIKQGQATLKGAIYGIYDLNNKLITELTTDENGYAISDKVLKYGSRYYLKEIKSSEGYLLDPTRYDFIVEGSAIITKHVKEKVIKNYISILKQYDFVDGNTTFLNAEEGIIFEIYYPNGDKYSEIITDKHGYAEIEIPYGIWKFHQKNSHDGFEKIYDFYIEVNETSEKKQYYNILNNKLSAYLQVFKVDAETNETIALADTTFKIFNLDNNSYVTQYVAGKVYDEFKTDEEGKIVTYLRLKEGNYKLVEVSSPKNYLLNTESLPFTIGKDTHFTSSTYGTFVTLYFKDQVIKGQLEIHKKGESLVIKDNGFTYEEIPLDNVIYEIYAKEDIKSADKRLLYYKKNQLVDTLTTDNDGYAISKKLYLGSYYLKEVSTKDTHILNDKVYEFTLTEKDNMTAIVYESYGDLNHLKKGTLEFTKTDISTGKPVPNAKFEIYHLKDDNNSELIYTGSSDKDGKIIINNLFVGKFKIVETNPATGYKLNNESIVFEIKENGDIVKAEMTNEKIKSTLKIHKVDNLNRPISGVEFGIYKEDGTLIGTYVTDENGNIEIEVEYGSYYYQELKTLDNLILDNSKNYFEITKDGEILEKVVVNNPIEVDVPNTGLNDSIILNVISVLLIIGGIGFLIYGKNKKK